MNELLLIVSLVAEFALVLLAYKFFGKSGLHAMTVFCALAANIEVMILVHAFGMDQTLGNILFAASFLVTDILSENEGKKEANRSVNIGIFVTVAFIIVSQSWLLYSPAADDFIMPSIRIVFKGTPRVMLASLMVYAVTQRFDVWLYHKWWALTNKKFGNTRRFLWLRNNGSTLVSQLLNTVLFNVAAFGGVYSLSTLITICASSYVIFVVTSLCDTPIVYLARRVKDKERDRESEAVKQKNGAENQA